METKTIRNLLLLTLGTIILALLGVPAAQAAAVPLCLAFSFSLGAGLRR